MSNLEYPARINELHQSEVLGEQAFPALMAAAKNEREKYHFGTRLQLEFETKVRLRPLANCSTRWLHHDLLTTGMQL